ncbi:hypothetical protein [Paracoccus sp. (in: a-proteobacteria)]|uniref:hypothetical protein n=1 Tax=Paracoccus sp. TaxID=267 RepID=UPI003220A14A
MAIIPRNPARESLAAIAGAVARSKGLDVVLAPQPDVSFTLSAALAHPLQALENSYQRAVREAGRREPDPERRQEAERRAVGLFSLHRRAAVPDRPRGLRALRHRCRLRGGA